MAEIEKLIDKSHSWMMEHRHAKRRMEALMAAIRVHALIDAYEAVGGSDRKWRNAVNKLW